MSTHCPIVPTLVVWACGYIHRVLSSSSMEKVTVVTGLVVGAWLKMVNVKFTWFRVSVVWVLASV